MNIKLTENEIELLVEILEEKLSSFLITDSANRFDYEYLEFKLQLILKNEKSLS